MQIRQLGKSTLEVSAMGLGCMGMSTHYGQLDDKESAATILHALDRGINFFDTSDSYGVGKNEELLGRVLKERRQEAVVSTKFGIIRGPKGEWLGVDGRPEYVGQACDASLQRLGMDVIDLYYIHRIDQKVPIEDTAGALARLVEQGKVRFLGLSEAGPDTIRRAHAVHPITALQSEYSLWTRIAEEEILPLCRELGIGYVAYAPLGRGFLTAGIQKTEDLGNSDLRRNLPRFDSENLEHNVPLLEPLVAVAEERSCTPAQITLAWVLSRGHDIVPIPGTKRRQYLDENVAALDIQLSKEECDRLEKVFAPDAARGDRYGEQHMKVLGM
jgi:aryl-alcohol dehydrogenase-like predicted oxidoreductase